MAAAQPSDAPDERSVPTLPTESEPPLRGPMPEWLRGQSEASAAPVDMPPAASLNATDTSSFITENDLPEWIRQIADADAAKQAEEQRRAAESALAASQEQPAAPVRVPLPGESASAQPASNPWLSRRDAASAQHAWTSVAQPASVPASQSVEVAGTGDSEIATAGKEAELVTASSTQPTAPAAPGKRSRKPSRLARSRATGSESDADVVDTPKRKLPRPDTGGDGANRTLRLVLLVVIIVVLGLALAFVV